MVISISRDTFRLHGLCPLVITVGYHLPLSSSTNKYIVFCANHPIRSAGVFYGCAQKIITQSCGRHKIFERIYFSFSQGNNFLSWKSKTLIFEICK